MREREIAELLKFNEEIHIKGETLPQDTMVYRVKVVTVFLYPSQKYLTFDLFLKKMLCV